jgi:hypothetical protein
MKARTALWVAMAATLAACGGSLTKPTATEADFGNSIESMRQAQAANPETIRNPSAEPPTGVDPDYANAVLETMRETVSKPEEVSQPITIRVGGQGQGGR